MRADDSAGREAGDAGYPAPLGPYLLLHRLATGGMGEVHLAKHGGLAGLEKVCVVKTLRHGALADDASVRRFVDEGRVVLNLSHRNICSVFDVGCADGRYYLAMEHISGRDLKAVLSRARERRVALSPALVLHVMSDVLEALDYAHRFRDPASGASLHLVHRDVSPANVMISLEGEVKLIDFGLAWSSVKQQLTEPNVVIGKVAYMAPEQLAGDALDARADVFAAGVLLYELLAGERFYGQLKQGDIVRAATSGRYLPPKLAILDDELQRILAHALAHERDHRFDSCAVLKESLVRYAQRRKLEATTGHVRGLMRMLFPDERERLRALLAHLSSPRADGARGALPCPPPTDFGALPPNFDPFEDFEVSEPSTPVGRVRLAKARPEAVKPGTPRPELLERLGLPPSGPNAAAPGPAAARPQPLPLPPETPPETPQPAQGIVEPRRRRPVALAVAAAFVVAAALAVVVLPTQSDPPTTTTSSLTSSALTSSSSPSPSPSASSSAATSTPAPTGPERPRMVLALETDAAVASRPRRIRPPSPSAKPEQKLRYLDKVCRKKTSCAGPLVERFRAMKVDDARRFWTDVEACVRDCAR